MPLNSRQKLTLAAAAFMHSPAAIAEQTGVAATASLIPLLLTTLAIVGGVIACGYFAKRVGRGGAMHVSGGVEILAAKNVGTRERIVVVQIGQQQLVVGTAPGCVKTLFAPEEPLLREQAPETTGRFADALSGLLRRSDA